MAEVIQLPFASGIDEGGDPKGLAPGTPLVMTNYVLDKRGRARKRWGVASLATSILGGGSISAGKRLVTRGDDLALFDGTTLYAYSPALLSWQGLDRPAALSATREPLVDSVRSVEAADIALYGDMLVTAYVAGSVIFVQMENVTTGAKVLGSTLVASNAAGPRVVVNGTSAYIFYASKTLTNVYCRALSLTALTLGTEATLVTDALISTPFDAVIGLNGAGATTLYLAYELAAGASRVRIASFTTAFVAVATRTFAGTLTRGICLAYGTLSSRILLSYVDGTAGWVTYAATATLDLGAGVAPTVYYAGDGHFSFIAEYSATEVLVGAMANADGTDANYFFTELLSVAALAVSATTLRITYGVYAPAKPFTVNGRWYVAACAKLQPYDPTAAEAIPQASVVVLELETASSLTGRQGATHPHAATLENQTGWYAGDAHTMQKAAVHTSGDVFVPAAYRYREPANATQTVAIGWGVHRLTTSGADMMRSAVIGGGALCAGAVPLWYDGVEALPYSFAHAPEIISVVASAGGSMAVGDYGYTALYTRRDAVGLLHRSTASPPMTGTTSGADLQLAVTVGSASISGKARTLLGDNAPSPIFVDLYRTTVNGSDSYRLSLEPGSQVLINDSTAADVSLTDTKADANIATVSHVVALSTQAQIYSSNSLDDVAPPAAITVLSHKDRLWLIASDGHTVWASKAISEDPGVAPGFNEALTIYYARDKNALGALDESVVVLGPDTIDILGGLGPDNQGNGSWAMASVQTDVGCIEPRSVVAIPQGLVFQSRRSLELLGRDRTLAWFGEPVQDQLALYPTITSAVVVADQHQVRFTCNTADLTDGIVLVFDYVRSAWSTFDYGFAVADAAMVGGVYTLLKYNGTVLQEDTTTHLDNGAYVAGAVEVVATPGSSNGWHRLSSVQVLGTSSTAHQLTIKARRDFSASYEQTLTFLDDTDVTTVGPLEKARIKLVHQKGQGFAIRIEDAAPLTGTLGIGAGPILEGLALYVMRKEGLPKLSGSRKG